MQKHEFAFFYKELSSLLAHQTANTTIILQNQELYYRLAHVLRIKTGETITLFDNTHYAQLHIESFPKKNSLQATVLSKQIIKKLTPEIMVVLPLLKKDAFEQSLYSCVELGANVVQLIITQKAQRPWSDKDLMRAHNIVIAAAEQSKNFDLPALYNPIPLEKALATIPSQTYSLGCSIQGQPLFHHIKALETKKNNVSIALFIGPEGDFTEQEYAILQNYDVSLCSLTPTILRSSQALVVALGALRSVMR